MRLLVTGANGQLGVALARLAPAAGHETLALTRAQLDIADRHQVEQAVASFAPHAIINAAAMTNVDGCELDPAAADMANALGPRFLAQAASRVDAHLVHVSTDYVFDGTSGVPYREWDATNPVNRYGQSKLGGEREVADHATSWTVARTSWVFGARGNDIVSWALGAYDKGELNGVLADSTSVPTYAPDLAVALLAVAGARVPGLLHVVNGGEGTRWDLCTAALAARGDDIAGIAKIEAGDLKRPAVRPDYTVLETLTLSRVGLDPLRPWRDAVVEYIEGAT
jgi:dTDP-4-dehydrorhamnose reductase